MFIGEKEMTSKKTKILHISDFHITTEMSDPDTNEAFVSLMKYIDENNLNQDDIILVYTGDIIDSQSVDKRISIEKKYDIWAKRADVCYKNAEKYFRRIINKLHISSDKIIIACGNHDVCNYVKPNDSFICKRKNPEERIKYNTKRFEKWLDFYKGISDVPSIVDKNGGTVIDNYSYSINGLNFLINNSQWIDKWGKNNDKHLVCANCESMKSIMKSFKIMDKKKNIFVSHVPITCFCEDLQAYPTNDYENIHNCICNKFNKYLCGDLHTNTYTGVKSIVGAPLSKKNKMYVDHDQRITYRIIDINEGGVSELNYSNNEWITNNYDFFIEWLKLSKKGLKKEALQYFWNTNDIKEVIEKVYEDGVDFVWDENNDKYAAIKEIYKQYINLREFHGDDGIKIDFHDNIFEELFNKIDSVKSKDDMTVAIGEYRCGKSIFNTAFYFYYFKKLIYGKALYYPLIINLENCKDAVEIKSIVDNAREVLDKNIENGKIFLILDGVPEQNIFEDEKSMLDDLAELMPQINAMIDNIYICYDSAKRLKYGISTIYEDYSSGKYVVYFNSIIDEDKKNSFIKAFCKLEDIDEENAINKIKGIHIRQIDFSCLTIFKEFLKNKSNLNFSKYIKKQIDAHLKLIDKSISASSLKKLANFIFKIYICHKDIEDLTSDNNMMKCLKMITKHDMFVDWFLAYNFVMTLKESKKSNLQDDTKEVVNHYYDDKVTFHMLSFINENCDCNDVMKFAKENYDKLDYSGKSMMTYLVSRLDQLSKAEVYRELCDEKKKLDNIDVSGLNDVEWYNYYVAMRSIYIAGITIKNISEIELAEIDFLKDYCNLLLSNSEVRRINRDFYLQYYDDRKRSFIEENRKNETILSGLDFYNTYHVVRSKLNKSEKLIYHKIELFTLCDLIYIRLKTPNITHKYDKNRRAYVAVNNEKSYFYVESSKYIKQATEVLSYTINIIDKMQKELESDDMFNYYFDFFKYIFKIAYECINNNKQIELPCKNYFDSFRRLEKEQRAGWAIKNKKSHYSKKEILDSKEKCNYETVLTHISEAYWIAFLYLPFNGLEKEYNKQKVLNMLLIHDLGESEVGDYPSVYSKYKEVKKAEDTYNTRMYISKILDGNDSFYEYLDLWVKWKKYEENQDAKMDINIKIAKDIDIIQMITKLCILLEENDETEILTKSRIQAFLDSYRKISTDYGKDIISQLFQDNKSISDMFKKYYRE